MACLRCLAVFLATLVLFCLAPAVGAEDLVAVPPLAARVTDLTQTLSADQRQRLEGELRQFEAQRGSQIAVLILPSTRPETIEQFGIRLAEAWKLGRKGIDDAVIVIVAKNDRRVRLEVGSGLEGAVNDATAKRIISKVMTPRFKAGDYYGGLEAGLAGIRAVVAAEPLPPAAGSPAASRTSSDLEGPLVIGLIAAALVGSVLRMHLGDLPGASVTAAGTGIAAWLITASLASAVVAAVAGFFLALFGLNLAWGFLSGRGGGFGGGFRGGGGSFGGGGASGDW